MSLPIFDPPAALGFADALQARLDTLPSVEAYVLQPIPDKPATGYVWAQVGGVETFEDRMDGLASDAGQLLILHCCGFTPEQALLTDDLVADVLRDWRWSADPSISPLRVTSASAVVADESVPSDIRWSITRMYRYDA